MLSYEYAAAEKWISEDVDRRSWFPLRLSITGGAKSSIFWTQLPQLTSSARSYDGYVEIAIAPRVVLHWRRTPLARTCEVGGCVGTESDARGTYWCGSRHGLIGRDLLRMNQMLLVMDSWRDITYVVTDREFADRLADLSRGLAEIDEWEPDFGPEEL